MNPPPRSLLRLAKGLIVVAGVLIVVNFTLVQFRPTPAQAFPGEAMAAAIFREVRQIFRDIRGEIRDKLNKALKVSADVAFKNSLRVFVGKLAEDTATWIASAGTGQKPLFVTDKKYFSNLGLAAAGDFIDTYAKDILGTSLCQPIDIQQRLNIIQSVEGLTLPDPIAACRRRCTRESETRQTTIKAIAAERQRVSALQPTDDTECKVTVSPGCTAPPLPNGHPAPECYEYAAPPSLASATIPVSECMQAFDAILSKEQARDSNQLRQCVQQCQSGRRIATCSATEIWKNLETAKVSQEVSLYFEAGENDVGQLLKLYDKAKFAEQAAIEGEKTVIDSPLKPPQSKVTGEALAPSKGTEQKLNQAIQKSTEAETQYTGSIAADTVRIFTNTLVQKLTERFFKSKCGLNPNACKGPGQANSPAGSLLVSNLTGVAAARLQFSSIGQIDYISGESSQTEDVFQILRTRGLRIDERLVQAVTEKRTVQEALDAGLLNGTATFGYNSQGVEPDDGFPYRLVLYLRHYRIVPVGWELAAQYIGQFDHRNIGLKELVALYDQRTVKNQAGDDVPNPYYHLIDPNWVLKVPATYCKRRAAGEEIVSRRFVCDEDNDARTYEPWAPAGSFSVDGNINCSASGSSPAASGALDIGRWSIARNTDYCTDEQSCIAENDDGSCKQFGYCFAEKPIWRFSGTSCPNYAASCLALTTEEGLDVAYNMNTTDSRNCSADVAGCRWYCADPAGPAATGAWSCTVAGNVNKTYLDRDVAECDASVAGCTLFYRTAGGANLLPNPSFERMDGVVDDATSDTFPGWTAAPAAVAVTSDLQVPGGTNSTAASIAGSAEARYASARSLVGRRFAFSISARAAASGACTGTLTLTSGLSAPFSQTIAIGPDWQRYAVSAPAATADNASHVVVANVSAACATYLDLAQLEERSGASSYAEYGTSQAALTNKRISCTADEVGCEHYTPVLSSSPAVDGVVGDLDRCSISAVGCRAYRETAVDTVPQRPARDVNVIASTGRQCSAAAVGCEEYTNLNEQAAGGESREYFSFLKQCVRPDHANVKTYFSWVGSESRGYELKSYRLLKSNLDDSPCTNLNVGSLAADPVCIDAAATQAICDNLDLDTNPDCTEFFDEAGNVRYRLRSRTIVATDRCYPARNSVDAAAGLTTIYMVSPDESLRCAAAEAGCREYKGNTGNAVRDIVKDPFESASAAGWTVPAGSGVSPESLHVGGHSLRLGNGTAFYQGVLPTQLRQGSGYVLTFIAKAGLGGGTLQRIAFRNAAGQELVFLGANETLHTTDWNLYRFGPVNISRAVDPQERLAVSVNGEAFLDNVTLTEVQDTLYQIKDSARACALADVGCELFTDRSGQRHALTGFTRLCGPDKVGCEEVIDTRNSTNPFEETVKGVTTPADVPTTVVVSANAACRVEEKGCSALGQPTIDANNVIADWDTVYRTVDPDRFDQILCLPTQDQCREYTSKIDAGKRYFRDPGERVCVYQRLSGSNEYGWFLNGTTNSCPSTALVDSCEVRIVGGGEQLCYRSSAPGTCEFPCVTRVCESNQSGCTEYRDPADPPSCRIDCPLELVQGKPRTVDEFCRDREPRDGGLPGCTSYTYLKQTIEDDVADCGNQVDPVAGCRPFLDTSNPERNFRGG